MIRGGANPSVVSDGGRYHPREDVRPGIIVGVMIRGVSHEGLISDRSSEAGRPYVLNKSKRLGYVADEPWESFCGGRPVYVVGYPGSLDPEEVIRRARARVGERWAVGANCQHFTRECHGLVARSPGVNSAGRILFWGGLAVAVIVGVAR